MIDPFTPNDKPPAELPAILPAGTKTFLYRNLVAEQDVALCQLGQTDVPTLLAADQYPFDTTELGYVGHWRTLKPSPTNPQRTSVSWINARLIDWRGYTP